MSTCGRSFGCAFAPRPTRSPMYSIGASSRSPSPMTIVPSIATSSSVLAHRFDGGLDPSPPDRPSHRRRAGDRRLFDDAQQLEREVDGHRCIRPSRAGAPPDPPRRTPSRSAALAALRRTFEVIRAAEQRADLARRDVGIGRDDARDRLPAAPSTACAARRRPAARTTLRSRLVTTLPKRSTRTTTPAQDAVVERRLRQVEQLIVA